MTLFTKNPLERLMMQRPYPGKEETPRTIAPEGHSYVILHQMALK